MGRLVVVTEARFAWAVGRVFSLAELYCEQFARTFGLLRRAAGDGVADVGVVVLYWGAEQVSDEGLVELRRLYGGIPDAPVVRATVVRRGPKEGVVDQYLGFCRIWRCLGDACRG